MSDDRKWGWLWDCYSGGPFDTREQAIADARMEEVGTPIYVGRYVPFDASEVIGAIVDAHFASEHIPHFFEEMTCDEHDENWGFHESDFYRYKSSAHGALVKAVKAWAAEHVIGAPIFRLDEIETVGL